MEDLRQSLTEGQAAALTRASHGLGGVGKTQMALEYAYRFAPEYDLVWWLRSEDTTSLTADYARLAVDAQFAGKGRRRTGSPGGRGAAMAESKWQMAAHLR